MRWTLALLLLSAAAPVVAQDDPLAPVLTDLPPPKPMVPVATVPKDWRGVFAAIRAEDWVDAKAGIDALGDHSLKAVAKAQLYTAKNSPKAELNDIMSLLAEAPDLPQAVQLQRMAVARGAIDTPTIITPARVIPLASAPRRHRSNPVQGEPAADALRIAMEPMVKSDMAVDAEALYTTAAPTLSPEARAEAAQRVAWIYYVTGLDAEARRVAESGIDDPVTGAATGEWGSQAHWIAGLAAWRQGDCEGAALHFRGVAYGRSETELAAAGAYWAGRAEMACRRPERVETLMKVAAKSPESFYGLVARETLGMDKALPPTPRAPAIIGQLPNVRRAIELASIGERGLAEELLRHQCRIGSPSSHSALAAKARELDLPGAAFWIAHNGPMGAVPRPPTGSRCRAGRRRADGGSIRRWLMPTSARKAISACRR